MKTQNTPLENKIRIFVVDDHEIVRNGIRLLLSKEKDLTVCGEASNVNQAMADITELKPDLAVVDLMLADESGVELIKNIKQAHPRIHLLVLSMHDESLFAERALRAGAEGYVTKGEAARTIVSAIRKVWAGEVYLSEQMKSHLLRKSFHTSYTPGEDPSSCLTDRELQVFRFLGIGEPIPQIAEKLHLSPKTIESYQARMKRKLNLKGAVELRQYAIQWMQQQERV
jgi:DNA-binding NarL/FixJ family response regulator